MIKNRNLRKREGEIFCQLILLYVFITTTELAYISYKMMKPEELPAAKTWQQEFTQALKSNEGQFTLRFPGKITKIHHI